MKRLTTDDILGLIANPETDKVEFKEAKSALPRSFWESYSAFANTNGGIILLGVKEEEKRTYHVQGVKNAEKLMQDIWNNANNRQKISANILFNRCVYAVDCGGKTVVVVDVPRPTCHDRPVFVGTNPYTGSFRRNGEGDYHCSEEAVDAMLRNRSHEAGDRQLVETLTIADLNQDTLRRYRTRLQMRREGAPWNEIDDETFLLMTGAAKRDGQGIVRPTLAALLMFGNFGNIVGEFPHYFVDYIEKLDDNPRYSDRISPLTADWSGNLYDFYSRVASRLTADVKTPFALDKEMYRIDDTPVHKSIRECLANTLVHADFYGRRGIRIEKHFRRITFANPGTFRVPLEIAISGGTSDARNDVLFTLFALVEIGEKLGTGLVQLFALWEQNGWPRPEFKEQFDPERTFLTLDFNDPEDNTPQKTDGTPQKTGNHEQESGDENGKRGNENRKSGIENTQKGSEKNQESGEKIAEHEQVNSRDCDENGKSGPENSESGNENRKSDNEKQSPVIENPQEGSEKTQEGSEKTQEGSEKTQGGSEKTQGGSEKTSQKILNMLNQDSMMTIAQLSKMLSISERAVSKQLRNLQFQGRLRRVGPDKGGHWEVLETN